MPSGVYKRTKATCLKISKARIGHKHTKATCLKISNAHIGNKHTKETRRKMSKAKIGKKFTKEHRKNMSKSMVGLRHKSCTKEACRKRSKAAIKLFKNPKNHPRWQGGISFELYTIEFTNKLKQKIRKRDKNICQLCLKRKHREELAVHHIDYNKKNCKEYNLTSLHRKCNFIVNGNRDYWYAYFKYIMEHRDEKKKTESDGKK